MLLKLLRWGSRTVIVITLGLLARHAFTSEDIETRWVVPLVLVLVAAIVVAVVTFEPILKFFSRGPKLVNGDFIDYTRNAIAGPDLQVFGVEIYNERESGGEAKTARDVVPTVEAYTLEGERVTGNRGVWFPDGTGDLPATVTFRPTHERHAVELAGKFPSGDAAWLAGEQDPPSLAPGIYEIRVTLRGDNLRRPAKLKFFVRNPGAGGLLTAAKKRAELESVTPAEMPDETLPDPQPKEEPEPEPEPPSDPLAEIDALLEEAEELDRLLWERVKTLKRSGAPLPALGTEFLSMVKDWNQRVLAMADEYLSLRDAAKVDALAGWTSVLATSDRIDALIQDNSSVLYRIRPFVQARQQRELSERESGSS